MPVIAVILIAAFYTSVFAVESKSVAVLGFVNLGGRSDASVNKSITRSLITFLSKIPDISITSYEAVEKAAYGNKYWESKTFSPEAAVDMGLSLAVSEVVSGDYAVDRKKGTVTVDVYVYDTASAAMKLQRQYTGEAGMGLFNTIDKMIRNISTLITGRTIKMGRLQVEIEDTGSYKLSINGKFMKKISKSDGYSDSEIAEEPMDITLRVPATEEVIYRTNLSIGDGMTADITYNPGEAVKTSPKSPEKIKIALFDFDTGSGIGSSDLITINDALRTAIIKTGRFEMMQKKKSGYKTDDLTSDEGLDARLKLGRLVKAKLAVVGSVNTGFKKISMNVFLIDLESGLILFSDSKSCSSDEIFNKIDEIALDISGKMDGGERINSAGKGESMLISGFEDDGSAAARKIRYNPYIFSGDYSVSYAVTNMMAKEGDKSLLVMMEGGGGLSMDLPEELGDWKKFNALSFWAASDTKNKFFSIIIIDSKGQKMGYPVEDAWDGWKKITVPFVKFRSVTYRQGNFHSHFIFYENAGNPIGYPVKEIVILEVNDNDLTKMKQRNCNYYFDEIKAIDE